LVPVIVSENELIEYVELFALQLLTWLLLANWFFYPNGKYNFPKSRIRATSASAFARGSAQAVFSLS